MNSPPLAPLALLPRPETGDRFDVDLARSASAALAPFNVAGVLAPSDVHVAELLLELAGIGLDTAPGPWLALAAALAVRAPRLGHVCVDLRTVAATVGAEADPDRLAELRWPEPAAWRATVAGAETLVALGDDAPSSPLRPLRLIGDGLFLDRYWRQESDLALILGGLDRRPLEPVELPELAAWLVRLFPDDADAAQRAGAACMALRGLTVLAGGPGTGKTTTVARAVALVVELALARDGGPPLIALCAPTGKAAARLAEAVAAEAGRLAVRPQTRELVSGLGAGTIHRLLGARGEGRFRHHRGNPLPHDLVIVDETSMVSLSLISHLLAAVRSDARVVFVGDPDQLSAIEAGAVLRDIVGPAATQPTADPAMRAILERTTGHDPGEGPPAGRFGSGIVVLTRSHRFGSEIGELADAIRRGDGDRALDLLAAAPQDPAAPLRWLARDAGASSGGGPGPGLAGGGAGPAGAGLAGAGLAGAGLAGAGLAGAGLAGAGPAAVLRPLVEAEFAPLLEAARRGDGPAALADLGRLRLLCAHRRGPHGVQSWTAQVEAWLADRLKVNLHGDYPGRPLLLTENDRELRLFNGDSGVVVTDGPGAVSAVFRRDGMAVRVPPARLGAIETAYASTIHKSQGSQFATAVVLVPDADSRLLSRELLYTAVTRARDRLVLVGTPDAVAAAIARPVQRATGLAARLW